MTDDERVQREHLEQFVSDLEEQSMTIDDGPLSQQELGRRIDGLIEAVRREERRAVLDIIMENPIIRRELASMRRAVLAEAGDAETPEASV